MIEVEETRDSEEDIQMSQLTKESENIKMFESAQEENSNQQLYEESKLRILELNNPFINQLILYMEGENYYQDLSYSWLGKVHNLTNFVKSLYVTQLNIDKILNERHISEEFKIIKLLTEDKKHKENHLKISRNLLRSNRYTDILPYQYNIALIGEEIQSENNLDESYINASYIDGPLIEDSKFFIATQGPMRNTICKFWKLIFTKNVKLFVMLCNLEEDSRKKCECYWPSKQGTVKRYEDIDVYLEKENYVISKCLIKRDFIIRFYGIEKRVTQLQMLNWPDHNIPEEDTGFITIDYILNAISDFRTNFTQSPILLHCSAGTGRTGTLIAIHNIIRSFTVVKIINQSINVKQNKIKPFFSVFNIVRKLREQRLGMVSSSNQYKFIYQFVLEWLKIN